jgi:phage shock protein A
VVGHIAAAGFSEFGSSKILSSEEAKTMEQPFNIALGAVLYKSVNPNFTQLVEKSLDPDDSAYQKVSASWEVGFNDYVLAVGSADLQDSKIVSDPIEIQELQGFLRSQGGSGKTDDGEEIYRLIQGDIFPLGIAYTLNPAADVKGLYSEPEKEPTIFINDKRDKISQKKNLNVNNEKDINAMELENTISELKELLNEKKFSKEAVANMTDTFAEAIRQRDEQYRQDIEAEKNQKEAVSAEYDALKATVGDLEEKLGQANDRISVFENEKRAEEAVSQFNHRMDELDEKFELDDQDREFLATELKEAAEEEAYAAFASKLEVLWKHKSKEAQAAFNDEIQKRIDEEVAKRVSNASTEEVEPEAALDSAEETEAAVPNANEAVASKPSSLRDKFKAAFSRDNIEIS